MGFIGNVICHTVALLLIMVVLECPSEMIAAETGDELQHQAFIETVINGMTRAIGQIQVNRDAVGFFASAVSLQTNALGQAAESMGNHTKDRRLRDFTASMVNEQMLDLKHFRECHEGLSFSPLQPAASQSFSRLMAEVLASFREDLAVHRSPATEESFVRFLVAHHAAVVDMAKIFLIFEEDPGLRSIVQHMLSQQQIELKALKNWKVQA